MANAAQSITTKPTYIQVGPGSLWYNVTKPGDGSTLQVSGTSAAQLYGPVPFTESGQFLGLTIGESTYSYRPQFVDIWPETSTAKVEKVLSGEEARAMFSVAEMTISSMALSIPVGTTSGPTNDTINAIPGGGGAQKIRLLKVGGLRLTVPQCIAFISANRRATVAEGPFSYVFCGYAAIAVDGFDAPFSRGRETVWRLTFEMIADTSRTLGDQLFQFAIREAA